MLTVMKLSAVVMIGVSAAVLSGCGGASSVPAPTVASIARQAANTTAPKSARDLVYISDQLEKSIVAFPAGEHAQNPPPVQTLSLGVITEGIWVDRNGILYAALSPQDPSQFGKVEEFKPGATQPFLTITNGIGAPSFVVVDANGTLYVDQTYDLSVQILEYRKGRTSPFRTVSITEKGEGQGGPMTLDRHGNLYVHTSFIDNQPSKVYEIARGGTTAQNLGLSGLGAITGLSSDAAGNLYVADANFGISVYAPGQTQATREIVAPQNNIFDDFVTTRSGKLYAAQGADGYDTPSLLEYAAGGSQPVNVLSGYLQAPLIPALRAAAF